MATSRSKRVRLSAEERREQIVEAATQLVARHGFNGLALQEVADAVGITQAGLLHYIGNKDGLVELLMSDRYDRQGTPQDFLDSGDPAAVHPEGMSLPAYFRYLVAHNEARPQLMGLYMTLGVEATDPGSKQDFSAFARQTGNALLAQVDDGDVTVFYLRRR